MTGLTVSGAWEALRRVMDPEVPVLSVCELGIVREVRVDGAAVDVVVTPTYSGCPATEAIEADIRDALVAAGAASVRISTRLAPAWTTDWIDDDAKRKLEAHGIAAPARADAGDVQPLRFVPACPRCRSRRTERLSQFGSTACKALHRCLDCLEPFEYFKAI